MPPSASVTLPVSMGLIMSPFVPRAPIAVSDPSARLDALTNAMANPWFYRALPALRNAARRAGCPPPIATLAAVVLAASCLIPTAAAPDIAGRSPFSSKRGNRAPRPLPLLEWALSVNFEPTPARCIAHLLAGRLDHPPGPPVTVQELITRSHMATDRWARDTLIDHGMKYTPFPRVAGAPLCLLIATAHPQLDQLFLETPWSDRRWGATLRNLPGAVVPRDPISYRSGVKPRVVAIPLDSLGGCDAPSCHPPAARVPSCAAPL
jgi:hypothetical protein